MAITVGYNKFVVLVIIYKITSVACLLASGETYPNNSASHSEFVLVKSTVPHKIIPLDRIEGNRQIKIFRFYTEGQNCDKQ